MYNYVSLHGGEELKLLTSWLQDKVILDFLGGPNISISILKNGTGSRTIDQSAMMSGEVNKPVLDLKMEEGDHEQRNVCRWPLGPINDKKKRFFPKPTERSSPIDIFLLVQWDPLYSLVIQNYNKSVFSDTKFVVNCYWKSSCRWNEVDEERWEERSCWERPQQSWVLEHKELCT